VGLRPQTHASIDRAASTLMYGEFGMADMCFDHEKLDVYQVAIQFVAWSELLIREARGMDGECRDQIRRARLSVALNIAEGTGKRSMRDRQRYYQSARGSAMESAAALDALVAMNAVAAHRITEGKQLLLRIVAMLSRMTDSRSPSAARHG